VLIHSNVYENDEEKILNNLFFLFFFDSFYT
jgi:hypothetical protein